MKTRARALVSTLAVTLALGLAAAPPLHAQDWKGLGRLEGRVLDADGKPVPDATVKLDLPSRGGGTTARTDKKGKWAILGIAAGRWNIDVDVPGFTPKRLSVDLANEGARLPPVEVKLERSAPAGPSAAVLDAVQHADEAYKAGRYAEARAAYESVLAMRPDLARTLHTQIARCYSQEGNYAKEMEHLQALLDADPTDQTVRLLMAQEAIKGGMLDRGRELLKGVDDSAVRDPNVYFNIAALLLNQSHPEEAITYLTRTVALDPSYVDAYFQRGLAYLQLGRTADARTDLQKVVELAPGTPQAETARKGLDQLK